MFIALAALLSGALLNPAVAEGGHSGCPLEGAVCSWNVLGPHRLPCPVCSWQPRAQAGRLGLDYSKEGLGRVCVGGMCVCVWGGMCVWVCVGVFGCVWGVWVCVWVPESLPGE